MTETYTFQAETQQLLDILIHSLYTDREIFLRELVSNASDALNRMQFEQLTREDVVDASTELSIRITWDEDAGTLTVSDTGIGMTRDEVIENLGTIARSGAKTFINAMRENTDKQVIQEIIGQFGVGFYSVFMAADRVEVITRSFLPDAQAVRWQASGGTSYELSDADRTARGTDVILHVNDEAREFLSEFRLRDVIKRHSDYVAFPIYVGDSEEPVNSQTALWRQSPRETEQDEYNQFYRAMTMDFVDPLVTIHLRADVPMQFYALLFIPASSEPSPFSLRREVGLKLYARKVLIQEYSRELLPEYLQFMQGVVDSEDLPLNVNRETVRSGRILARLKSTITKRVLSDLDRLASDDSERYMTFYQQYGRFLKQGVVMVAEDKESLLPLLRFRSTSDDAADVFHSLSDYIGRMVEGQTDIYYVMADDTGSARRSPHLEAFRQRDIEVLYFDDPIDAVLAVELKEYRGHNLRAVDDADIDLRDVGSEPETPADEGESVAEDAFQQLRQRFEQVLGDRVKGVRESRTLVGSPARLISTDDAMTRNMYRVNRLLDKEFELPVKTLELNPRHPLMHNLSQMLGNGAQAALADAVVEQVFETALLQDGIHPDPASMAQRLTLLMQAATGTPASQLDLHAVPSVGHDAVPAADDSGQAMPDTITIGHDTMADDSDAGDAGAYHGVGHRCQ